MPARKPQPCGVQRSRYGCDFGYGRAVSQVWCHHRPVISECTRLIAAVSRKPTRMARSTLATQLGRRAGGPFRLASVMNALMRRGARGLRKLSLTSDGYSTITRYPKSRWRGRAESRRCRDDGWCDAGGGTIEERKTGLGNQADPRRHTGEGEQVAAQPPAVKPGRNEACFCGSGNKFQKCHG